MGWHGAAAAMAGLGASEAAAVLLRTSSPLDAAGTWVVDTGPVPLVEQTVRLLRTADKPVIRLAAAAAVATAGALTAEGRPTRWSGSTTGVATAAVLGAWLTGRTRSRALAEGGPAGRARSSVPVLAGAAVTLGALAAPWRWAAGSAALGVTGVLASLAERSRRRSRADRRQRSLPAPGRRLPPPRDGAETWPGVPPLLTPVDRFYVTDTNMRPPLIDPDAWRLAVTGTVARPLRLSLADLADLGFEEFDATLVCIHTRLGWDRLGNQRWTGVPLDRVLAAAGAEPDPGWLVTRAVDGFEASLPHPLQEPYRGYVVVGMGGAPLSAAHGAPARVFVPGLYGQYTGAKWLTELRVQAEPNRDYWLPRGWPRASAPVKPLSRIDTPRSRQHLPSGPLTVAGVAWAPPHGVATVEVALDGVWHSAELADELSPSSWRRWRARLDLAPGRHELRVRCTSRTGQVQAPLVEDPYPSGAGGHHTVTVVTA